MYQRCMFGNHDLVLKEEIIQGHAVTVMDGPFVSKAVENYFTAIDPYFAKEVQERLVKSSPFKQGRMFKRFMMKVFSEAFNTRPLSDWPHQPPISDLCPALVGKTEIVGWREPGLEQGTTHGMMSMEEFMDAHVNHLSTRNNIVIPVFVQMKLYQRTSNFSEKNWSDALSTVSAAKIEGHARDFRKYCPNNVYISMTIAYPTR
ncbi:hypothetical protein B0O80DRAFT_431672 [Mortierella sp. GBAus27b]|nr:hypothetical protein B0O80DRAFT_431672 [Mortierella sp. GBAus27b]